MKEFNTAPVFRNLEDLRFSLFFSSWNKVIKQFLFKISTGVQKSCISAFIAH